MSYQSGTSADGSASTGVATGYRWLATVLAALVVLQAFLGIRGFFVDNDLITMHEMIANAMFLLAIVQLVLAWMLYSRKSAGMGIVVLNVVLVLLTVGQIGLGYMTRESDIFSTAISLHVPNGVLLMGVVTIAATLAWRNGSTTGGTQASSLT